MFMKWVKETDDELIRLIHLGKRHYEIAEIFNTTAKSIQNRCFRLKIKTVYHKEVECKQCGVNFFALINNERKFCSSKCSGISSGTGRIHTEESKEKRRQKLTGQKRSEEVKQKTRDENNGKYIDGRSKEYYLKRKDKVEGKRKCKYCNEYKIDKKKKLICDECRGSYYKSYRPSCEFDFDIKSYKENFDFLLIEKYGWYSPSNKGNNLNGVSRDHLYSVRDGFINKVSVDIIKHPANCQLMKQTDNSSKKTQSSITLDELLKRIEKWEENYGKE